MNKPNKPQKPTRGRLIYLQVAGPARVLANDLPFGMLQNLRQDYIAQGWDKTRLKITYMR